MGESGESCDSGESVDYGDFMILVNLAILMNLVILVNLAIMVNLVILVQRDSQGTSWFRCIEMNDIFLKLLKFLNALLIYHNY